MFEFWRFKPVSTETHTLIEGNYNSFLVSLSFLISFLAAYALLIVLERAWQSNTNKALMLWKVFGSIVFGLGVWAMHFTGMLSFMLPIPMHFEVGLTIVSVFTPMISAYLALGVLSKENFSFVNIHWCALFLALGIGSMHFIGMEAMHVEALMSYDPILFIASIGMAYMLAAIAIYLIKVFNKTIRHISASKIFSSLVMGAAVACMHYVAMAAVSFHISLQKTLTYQAMNDNAVVFSLAISGIVFVIVATTILCALIEDKLQKAETTIEESAIREKEIVEQMADGLLTIDSSGVIEGINSAGFLMFAYTRESAIGCNIQSLMKTERIQNLSENSLDGALDGNLGQTMVAQGVKQDGSFFPIEVNFSKISIASQTQSIFNCVVRDITHRVQLEDQLRQSQKLESIGQLSAGIAHEINTPTQYIADNTMFLNTAFDSCIKIINGTKVIIDKDISEITLKELEDMRSIYSENDMEFIVNEIPLAISQSIEGLERVTKIIGAMKSFSHSSQGEMSEVDITEAINSTVTVSRSEWRYIANLSTDYSEHLPKIKCIRDEFNQVILNFIVNAAHAIEERYGKQSEQLGNIKIAVSLEQDKVQISIRDDGIGMSNEVKNRIFDPFFTTKEVGKGTGQGLSMAYSVIVDKHNGSIDVESELNVGTQFNILVPAA